MKCRKENEMIDIEKLKRDFNDECYEIAEECEAEGYPRMGSNYDLRVSALMEDEYYAPLFQ